MKKNAYDILDKIIAFKVRAKRRISSFTPGRGGKQLPWRVTKVLLFNEDTTTAFPPNDDTDFVDLTGSFDMTREHLMLLIDDLRWNAWKLEIRYIHHGSKYRVVYRNIESFAWPPKNTGAEQMNPPDLLLSAHVHPVTSYEGKMNTYDATKRLKKYEGPRRDFGGRTLYAQDIFPMDDAEELAKQFGKLVMVSLDCSEGRVVTRSIDFSKNEPIFFAS